MIEILNNQFGLEGHLTFRRGNGGLVKAVIANAHAAAEVYLHGAHVTHYQPVETGPVLWISDSAVFAAGKAIRGGVPVCWPWFGVHATNPEFPQHGFARVSEWSVVATASGTDGTTSISLVLEGDGSLDLWPHPFRLCLAVTVGKALTLSLTARNNADVALEFGAALHSYFRVGDRDSIRISGLDGCDYLDKPDNFVSKRQHGDILLDGEVDRVYIETTADCRIHDPVLARRIIVGKSGSRSTVVWNPGLAGALQIPDFDDDGYRRMVCVESANAASDTRLLEPRQSHNLVQRITVTY
ncbi:MAG: D-hexose-6-phosphate mutarotase [Gammaproteobacteria bacterium]|nr:D-hexose-6-phosphate mutarotase [Gammaproteobacteria bacterium]MDH3447922.1 D-hexose-6-phosphate mutarotase [Gammaproteobacteria bacterium]